MEDQGAHRFDFRRTQTQGQMTLHFNGRHVRETVPDKKEGLIPVAGPFRPGTEDWMLARVIGEAIIAGREVILVQEKANTKMGGYIGVSLWRKGVTRSK